MTQEFVYGYLCVYKELDLIIVPEIYTSLRRAADRFIAAVNREYKWRGRHEYGKASHYLLKMRLNGNQSEVLDKLI